MDQMAQCPAGSQRDFAHRLDAGKCTLSGAGQQTHQVDRSLSPVRGALDDSRSWSQPSPQSRRNQQLSTPAAQTPPLCRLRRSAKAHADRTGGLTQNTVAIESYQDDRRSIPAPGMKPVRQDTHRVATDPATKSPDPDLDPTDLGQATYVTQVQSVADQLQNPFRVSCRRTALWIGAIDRPEIFQRGSIRTSRAQLLD